MGATLRRESENPEGRKVRFGQAKWTGESSEGVAISVANEKTCRLTTQISFFTRLFNLWPLWYFA